MPSFSFSHRQMSIEFQVPLTVMSQFTGIVSLALIEIFASSILFAGSKYRKEFWLEELRRSATTVTAPLS
jgi:hypothetical protein